MLFCDERCKITGRWLTNDNFCEWNSAPCVHRARYFIHKSSRYCTQYWEKSVLTCKFSSKLWLRQATAKIDELVVLIDGDDQSSGKVSRPIDQWLVSQACNGNLRPLCIAWRGNRWWYSEMQFYCSDRAKCLLNCFLCTAKIHAKIRNNFT